MRIEYLFIIIMFGFITSYLVNISFLKKLRNNENNYRLWEVIMANIFFGGPLLLLFYAVFDEIRLQDRLSHHAILIFAILFSIMQVVGVYLLFHFKLIILLT